jgi:hypothetical protein
MSYRELELAVKVQESDLKYGATTRCSCSRLQPTSPPQP